jgi:hypothetical protein
MRESTLAEFWDWWRSAGPRIARSIDSHTPLAHEDIEDVSAHVHAVHEELAWEFAPGKNSRHAFTITPEGNVVLRRLTERLVRAGPAPDDTWEYYPARQPVPEFALNIAGQLFDGADWRFGIEVVDSKLLVDLEAFHPKLKKIPKDARPRAGFIAVDQMFGEDAVETWIGGLSFTDRDKHTKSTAADVHRAIASLVEQSKEEVFSLAQGLDHSGRPLILTLNQRLKRLYHLFADTLVEVDFTLRAPDERGFPGPEELRDLGELEDRVVTMAKDAVHVGHLTGRGHRTTYFYTEDAAALRSRLDATLRDKAPYELRSNHDPEWSFYREGLYDQFASTS